MGLTSRQAKLLAFLDRYIAENDGVAPTYQEMEDGIDLHSRSEVHSLLRGLEDRGAIRRIKYRSRAIEVVWSGNPRKSKSEIADNICQVVWERVRDGQLPDTHGLRTLILAELS